jgi:succinate dehydrogenase/fumarate reductase flavoprotein subunit
MSENGVGNLEADIVVVGYGGAGAATALRAAELGARVIIVEKQPEDQHTPSTAMSGGLIFGVNDVDKATTYLDRCAGGMIPLAVSRAWAEKALDLVEWLEKQGTDLRHRRVGGAEHLMFEGAEAIDVYRQSRLRDGTPVEIGPMDVPLGQQAAGYVDPRSPELASGWEYVAALKRSISARPAIQVLWSAPARQLLKDANGRVTGIEVGTEGDVQRITARHGVVLTCGGYEYSEDIKANYLKAYPIYFYGNPDNTGDGVRMAMEAGADLWHMNQMIGRAIMHFDGEDGRQLNFLAVVDGGGYVILDRNGRRFANEEPQAKMRHGFYYHLITYDSDAREYPRIPCYWIFDSRRMARPLTALQAGIVGAGIYDWSVDNARELAQGWVQTAESIEELARKVGIRDPEAAARSLHEYNQICAGAGDDPFGRPPESLVPLEPPFYAVPLYPGGSNTCGGPRRNEHAQIVNARGVPIPGLYAAGELGESVGLLYPSDGGNLSESVCFGRIAAESALGHGSAAPGQRVAAPA